MTITQKLQKVGDEFVVVIPEEEVERLGFVEGQPVAIEITPLEPQSALSPELQQAFDESWKRNEAGYRYLADR